mgnify:CR=1 FL=1
MAVSLDIIWVANPVLFLVIGMLLGPVPAVAFMDRSLEVIPVFGQPIGLGFFYPGLAAGGFGAIALTGLALAQRSGVRLKPLATANTAFLWNFHGKDHLLP